MTLEQKKVAAELVALSKELQRSSDPRRTFELSAKLRAAADRLSPRTKDDR